MFNVTDKTTLVSFTKNLISDQTETGLLYTLGSPVFHATYGHGISTATSTITMVPMGGFDDQQITAVMRFRSPSVASTAELGAILRYQTNELAALTTYYYARFDSGFAKITHVSNTTFTNLAQAPFALQADVDMTIAFSVVGTYLKATFSASGLPTVTLGGNDANIPTALGTGLGGLIGWRTLTTAGYCSSVTAVQL